MNRFFITICLALVALAANAQTITDALRHDQSGQGKIVINQSADIERLVNNRQQENTTPVQSQGSKTPVAESSSAGLEKPNTPANAHPNTVTTPPATSPGASDGDASAFNTNKKIMRHSYKTTGYRIQVYSGGNKREDRTKCEQIAARLKVSFPDLPLYVHFYSPSWKCRAGNFTDLEEAKSVLRQIRAMGYNQACLVKGTVNVQY